MKKLFFFCALTALIYQARTSPLAFTALNLASLNPGQLPVGWQIKVTHGRPNVSVCSYADGPCLRLKSIKSSFGLERDIDVDLARLPVLNWAWKVTQLPGGGDFRHSSTDDQAAQILVAFADHRVLSYIWDTSAPKGTAESASFIPLVRIFAIVCESGANDLDHWMPESRDVAADYERAFGKTAPHVKGLRIQINSQHTGTSAESYFGGMEFHSAQQ